MGAPVLNSYQIPALVIVHDLNVEHVPVTPHKTQSPLVVDPNAVLTLPVTPQCFQTVSGWCRKISQLSGAVELSELAAGYLLDCSKAPTPLPPVQSFGVRATERPDHTLILCCTAFNVKQYTRPGRRPRLVRTRRYNFRLHSSISLHPGV